MSGRRHPDWCAQGHYCGLGEHRAEPLTLAIPGAGSVVLTRVQTDQGHSYAEVRMRVTLPDNEPAARRRLAALLTHLQALLAPPPASRAIRRAA